MLLNKPSTQSCGGVLHPQSTNFEDLKSARSSIRKILADSLIKLQGESTKKRRPIRWELGACWVQHLQNQASGKTEPKKKEESQGTKAEPTVKGLGKQFGQLKEIKKKTDEKGGKNDSKMENAASGGMDKIYAVDNGSQAEVKENMLQKLLPEAAYLRLKESETGLHVKVCFHSSF